MSSQIAVAAVQNVLHSFQNGYTKRDPAAIDTFMQLFADNAQVEVIGTSAIQRSNEEWCQGQAATRALILADWEGWGDLVLDLTGAQIHINGDVAWLSTTGTVSQTLPLGHAYAGLASFLQRFNAERAEAEIEEELFNVILGAASALAANRKGTHHVWPIRFAAVLVKQQEAWQFQQIHFSYPTVHLPQVRLP